MPQKPPRDVRAESLSRLEKDAEVLSRAIARFEKQSGADTSDLRVGLAAIEEEIRARQLADVEELTAGPITPAPLEVVRYRRIAGRAGLVFDLNGSGF